MRSRGIDGAREGTFRAASINEADRSFECVATTEQPATMIDWERYELIDEILVARGGQFASQLVLLRNHYRGDLEDIVGSARNFKLEDETQWACRGFVAKKANDQDMVDLYWSRIVEGHLRAVSIGYEVLEFTDIPPGEKKLVGARYFTAKTRRLRVSTKWRAHELSLTPIGADSLALIRSHMGAVAHKTRRIYR